MTRTEIERIMNDWLAAWNRHDLEEVMSLFSEDAVFETWTGLRISGRENIRKAWAEWFAAGGFSFTSLDMVIDPESGTVVFPWLYEGPAKCFAGKIEKRKGIDLIKFEDGLIVEKVTWTKTTIEVEGKRVTLTSGDRR